MNRVPTDLIFTIMFTWKLSILLFPGEYVVAFISCTLLATFPQFNFISSVITNDNLANLLSTVCLYYLFGVIIEGINLKKSILIGILLGLSFLTKLTTMFLFPVCLIIFLYVFIKEKDNVARRSIAGNFLILFSICMIVCGWFFMRNLFLYGDIFAWDKFSEVFKSMATRNKSLFDLLSQTPYWKKTFNSLVGNFGWMTIPVNKAVCVHYYIIILSGI